MRPRLSSPSPSHIPTCPRRIPRSRPPAPGRGCLERTRAQVVYEAALKGRGLGRTITTEIVDPAPAFHYAEEEHQQYVHLPNLI